MNSCKRWTIHLLLCWSFTMGWKLQVVRSTIYSLIYFTRFKQFLPSKVGFRNTQFRVLDIIILLFSSRSRCWAFGKLYSICFVIVINGFSVDTIVLFWKYVACQLFYYQFLHLKFHIVVLYFYILLCCCFSFQIKFSVLCYKHHQQTYKVKKAPQFNKNLHHSNEDDESSHLHCWRTVVNPRKRFQGITTDICSVYVFT